MVHPKAAVDIRVSISPYGLFKIQAVKQQLKLYVQPLKPRPHRMGWACEQNVGQTAVGTAWGSVGRSCSGVQNSWLFYKTLTQPLYNPEPNGRDVARKKQMVSMTWSLNERKSRTFQHCSKLLQSWEPSCDSLRSQRNLTWNHPQLGFPPPLQTWSFSRFFCSRWCHLLPDHLC